MSAQTFNNLSFAKGWQMTGNSMDDGSKHSIPDTSIVIGTKIPLSDFTQNAESYIDKVFVFVTDQDKSGLVKKMAQFDAQKSLLDLCSLNPNKASHPNCSVSLDLVKEIYLVTATQITRN